MPTESKDSNRLRPDIDQALRLAYPDGVIELLYNEDDGFYLDALYPRLRRKLSRIRDAKIAYEREPFPGPEWEEDADPEEDLPIDQDFASSYHLLFLQCIGKDMEFAVQSEAPVDEDEGDYWDEEEDDEDADEESTEWRVVQGTAFVGCAVGISVMAPFAVVDYDTLAVDEDGSQTEPDIDPHIFTAEGSEVEDLSEFYMEQLGGPAWERLKGFRDRIVEAVESFGITVLTKSELRKGVPFLEPGEGVIPIDHEVTVRDALFFRMP